MPSVRDIELRGGHQTPAADVAGVDALAVGDTGPSGTSPTGIDSADSAAVAAKVAPAAAGAVASFCDP